MTEHTQTSSKKLLRLKKTVAILAGLIGLYAVIGFLVVPPIIKSQLQKGISETLHAQATVTDAAMNPFVLSLTLRGFKLSNTNGELFAGFEELYINFQLSSLFRWAYTFNEIRLTAPEGMIKILPDGTMNLAALVPPADSKKTETAGETDLVPVVIHELKIENGRFDFSDLSRPTPFVEQLFPINIVLKNFSTLRERHGLHQFTASLGKGGTLNWEGTVSVNPVLSRGSIEMQGLKMRTLWEYIRDRVNFEVTDGLIDVKTDYEIGIKNNDIMFELGEGAVKLTDFRLTEESAAEALMSIPFVDCAGIRAVYPQNEILIGSITSGDASIIGWRARDGSLNYQTLFARSPVKTTESISTTESAGKTSAQKEWLIDVKNFALKNYAVKFEDRMQATPVRINLKPVNLNLKGISTRKDAKTETAFDMTVNETGTVEVGGTVCMNPQSADLAVKVKSLGVRPFQQYIGSVATVAVMQGTVGLDGRVHYETATSDKPDIRYRGGFRVDDLKVDDPVRSEDILKWKSLELNNIAVDINPMKVSIAEITSVRPYARVTVWQDGTTNLSRVFISKEDTEDKVADQPVQKPAEVEGASDQAPMSVKIDVVRIKKGSANFADFSLKPNFATGIQDLNGIIKGLSSNPKARADVDLKGAVDRYAPVTISGKINPLSPTKYIDLALSFKNMELAALTPYSGKFAGYKIDKGQMSLDFRYKILGNRLNGENKIFLNQLTLGERVESPDALSLPITLAIALLKDRAGNIDIDLPVQGDLQDPEFSYGRLIGRALVNLLTKIVTAPFAALASLVGGGEELSVIEFAYGDAELVPKQIEKLDTLARALYERPAVKLEIRGVADRNSDRAALAENALERHLKELKAEELRSAKKKVPDAIDDIQLSDSEYERLLTTAYKKRLGDKPEVKAGDKEKPINVLEVKKAKLMNTFSVEDIDLTQLAQERARQIKGYLIQSGKIESDRLYLLDVQIDDEPAGTTARTVLSLL